MENIFNKKLIAGKDSFLVSCNLPSFKILEEELADGSFRIVNHQWNPLSINFDPNNPHIQDGFYDLVSLVDESSNTYKLEGCKVESDSYNQKILTFKIAFIRL